MKLPPLKIRNLESKYPVVQAGMGVRVAMARLAAETIRCGGYGTIASVGIGDLERGKTHFADECSTNFAIEIRKAKELCGNRKPLGVNVMVALSNYEEIVRTAVQEQVDYIISGAGLPLQLPEYVGNADLALIPVVSSARAFDLVVRTWQRKYNRKPDAVIVEGPRNGGHLGFTMEQIEHPETCSLELLYGEIRTVACRYGLDTLPILAAGEIASRADIEHWLSIGVLKTPLVQRVLAGGREDFSCPYRCLRSCDHRKAHFCIARALIATWAGDVENGLYMVGCNVGAVKKIYPIREFFAELDGE